MTTGIFLNIFRLDSCKTARYFVYPPEITVCMHASRIIPFFCPDTPPIGILAGSVNKISILSIS